MLDFLGELKRTLYCGDLRATHEGQSVVLLGWVHGRRDLGHLIFLDIRDRAGIAQVVFNKETNAAAHAKAEQARSEFVVAVEGKVARRQKTNPGVPTGEVEVIATSLRILNNAKTPPFPIEEQISATEETRLRYRYLDLRRPKPHANLALRHRVILELRKAMDEMGFYEVETPMLTRSTPEGARDYLVPSRVHPGMFYALPQSPQIFKQILMISGFDKYFQIARCFRDEDLRADRQPDFTQLDLEMSFVRPEDVWDVIEKVVARMWAVGGHKVTAPFRRMKYKDALRRYGSDKPDLRFAMELQDVTPFFARPEAAILQITGNVYALVAPGGAEKFSRKHVDELTEKAKALGARACYTAKVTAEGVQSGLEKSLGAETLKQMATTVGAKAGDLIIAVAAKEQLKGSDAAALIAGQVRLYLADKLGLTDKSRWEFIWLSDFPLFEWADKENAWVPAQHPFTGVVEDDLDLLEQPARHGEIRSKGYDLVLNGVELGSGSVRNHRQDIQSRVFKALGLSDEQARQRFGFFLDALSYGTPPHGGIALGLDRVAMLIAGETSIREVIAFPKTAQAADLMADAPNAAMRPQVEDLELMIAFPGIEEDCWALAKFSDRLLRFIDEEVFDLKEMRWHTNFELLLLLFLAHTHATARSASQLAKSGFGRQAAVLTRTLFETAVHAHWIAKDPQNRTEVFAQEGTRTRRLLENAKRHGWPELSLELEKNLKDQLEEAIKEATDKPPRLREKALEVGLGLHYDWFYMLHSEIAHSEVGGLLSYFTGKDNDRITVGPSPEWVREALASTFVYSYQVLEAFLGAFPQVDGAKAKKIAEEFRVHTEAWGKKVAGK